MNEAVREAHAGEKPLIDPDETPGTLSRRIASIILWPKTTWRWTAALSASALLLFLFFWAIAKLLITGTGIWGVDIPVAWGVAIANFVWWIGIAHAGTLVSAILLLVHQRWRTSITRFAEAMTLFAIATAGLFPLLHLGRPDRFYYMVPYPDTMGLWPQFRSALVWDLFALLSYSVVVVVFFYLALLPDFATLRDRATTRRAQWIYGLLALGWRGAASQWEQFRKTYLLLAALTPAILSIHSVGAFNLAATVVPGWHSTQLPFFLMAGAILSGIAMVLTIGIPLRTLFRLEDLIRVRHLDRLAKLLLASAVLVAYGYFNEIFLAWYGGNAYEAYAIGHRLFGQYWPIYWMMIATALVVPQALWWRRVRTNAVLLFAISILVNVGMWTERFILVVTALHRDYLPSEWSTFHPTLWDWATLAGSFGLFATLFLLFVRFIPVSSIAELKNLLEEERS